MFTQTIYPQRLYRKELSCHNATLEEYAEEIVDELKNASHNCKNPPRTHLFQQQPYLTFAIRCKLIDFCMKMAVRLKIIPFVICKAVTLFDRYCSTRIVLLDQAQLIITTCLWIAAKVQGGNNHFINVQNAEKFPDAKTINDLGYGAGGRFIGPTQRYRIPKLNELVKLCGAKCKYDEGMFRQMELHILLTLEWQVNDTNIEDYLIQSKELDCTQYIELFKVKEFVAYCKLFSADLLEVDYSKFACVSLDVINEFGLLERTQTPNICIEKLDVEQYKHIKKHIIKSIVLAPDFLLGQFPMQGPQMLYNSLVSNCRHPYNPRKVPKIFNSIPAPHNLPDYTLPIETNYTTKRSTRDQVQSLGNKQLLFIRLEIQQKSASQTSIVSTSSRDDTYTSIFDPDSRGVGAHTPVTDEESPLLQSKSRTLSQIL